jgi:hypothetical protein
MDNARRGSCLLLQDVSQFMREQQASASGVRRILTRLKRDLITDRICTCIQSACRLISSFVRIDSNVTEIMSETRLH